MRLTRCARTRRSAHLSLAVALWLSMGHATLWAQELYATNSKNILVHGRAASGNTYPFRTLGGPLTLNERIPGLALDAVNDELFVLLEEGPLEASSSVRVYNRTADGNAAPIRSFNEIGRGGSSALTVDTLHGELFISHQEHVVPGPAQVRVCDRAATGSAAPLRTLVGASTGLNEPRAVVVDTVHNEMLVVNQHVLPVEQQRRLRPVMALAH